MGIAFATRDISDCPICFFKMNKCITLKCKHKFHKLCVNKWFQMQTMQNQPQISSQSSERVEIDGKRYIKIETTCPMCRKPSSVFPTKQRSCWLGYCVKQSCNVDNDNIGNVDNDNIGNVDNDNIGNVDNDENKQNDDENENGEQIDNIDLDEVFEFGDMAINGAIIFYENAVNSLNELDF
jgi:hypothetical protein